MLKQNFFTEKAEECPDFDDFDYEPILTWANAKVVWDDTFVDGHGNKYVRPNMAFWTLIWSKGFIGFDCIRKKEDEATARKASALFIYLWSKGVETGVASNCADLYARHVKVTK
jgi:hypothetical protein